MAAYANGLFRGDTHTRHLYRVALAHRLYGRLAQPRCGLVAGVVPRAWAAAIRRRYLRAWACGVRPLGRCTHQRAACAIQQAAHHQEHLSGYQAGVGLPVHSRRPRFQARCAGGVAQARCVCAWLCNRAMHIAGQRRQADHLHPNRPQPDLRDVRAYGAVGSG